MGFSTSFLLIVATPVCACSRTAGLFPPLGYSKSVTVYRSVCVDVRSSSFGYVLCSRIAASIGKCRFNYVRNTSLFSKVAFCICLFCF